MRRFFAYAAFAAVLAAFPIAHGAFAAGGSKTWVCRPSTSSTDGVVDRTQSYEYHSFGTLYAGSTRTVTTYHFGRSQQVSTNQVGTEDVTTFSAITDATEDTLTTLETYYTDTYQSFDYRPAYDYYGWQSVDYANTNADVGNGNCMWTTYVTYTQ